MFNYLVYLNDNCPPRNQYIVSNCINIINEIYKELRSKYRIPHYIDKYDTFELYLKDNDDIDEVYVQDLPDVCKAILKHWEPESLPNYLKRRVLKLQNFFGIK